jgi:ATP-dependent Clp protease ATP-binding subunit ClpA
MLRPQDGVLARFTRDLTAEARAGRLEPVRCREPEIDRVVDILLRQGKNNPVLVGPAGVGKTAIVEGLAYRLVTGPAPLALRGTRILSLDHVALLAGTMYRGQYEERLRGLVAETSAARDAILFVDELHNLMGQGTAMGVAMDAANMLKPALVRGEFSVIGATTDAEYDRWIRADAALERRFQRVLVRELSADETLDILTARREGLERHHAVAIADDALLAAVRLTDLFQPDRHRPDRALDALDEACAHAHAVAAYSPAAERLILAQRARERGAPPAVERAASEAREAEPESGGFGEGVDYDDAVQRMARDGLAALERFGAEIEALFGSESIDLPPSDRPMRQERAREPRPETPRVERPAPRVAPPAAPRPAAQLAAELRARLMEEGVVVRGHDVARVVSLASGKRVTWVE